MYSTDPIYICVVVASLFVVGALFFIAVMKTPTHLNKKKYAYGYRCVHKLNSTEDVEEELNEIYRINQDDSEVISLQVIPRFDNKEWPTLPSHYTINYVYRYEVKGEEVKD